MIKSVKKTTMTQGSVIDNLKNRFSVYEIQIQIVF